MGQQLCLREVSGSKGTFWAQNPTSLIETNTPTKMDKIGPDNLDNFKFNLGSSPFLLRKPV